MPFKMTNGGGKGSKRFQTFFRENLTQFKKRRVCVCVL